MNASQVRKEIIATVNTDTFRAQPYEFTARVIIDGVEMPQFDITGVAGDVIRQTATLGLIKTSVITFKLV